MSRVRLIVSTVCGVIGCWLGIFLGPADGLLITLVILAIVDYITGVISAAVNHKLSSSVGFKGLAKKVLMFALVGVGNLVDVYVLGGAAVLRSTVIFFYIANEALSIIENAGELGLPVPKKLKNLLDQLKDKNDEGDETDDKD